MLKAGSMQETLSDSIDLTGLRVLVVEDNFLVACVIQEALEGAGCEVVGPASKLQIGLEMAQQRAFDGAFLDIHLNNDFCFPIAFLLKERGTPFLFMTGYDDADAIPAELRSVSTLRKPFEAAEIVEIARLRFQRARV